MVPDEKDKNTDMKVERPVLWKNGDVQKTNE
jgi:hypothetical protein